MNKNSNHLLQINKKRAKYFIAAGQQRFECRGDADDAAFPTDDDAGVHGDQEGSERG